MSFPSFPGLYLECSVRGCNGRAGGLEDGSPPAAGSRSRAAVGPPEAVGTMEYCAYKNWFLCIIYLYFIAKTCTEIKRQAAVATLGMMYPARRVWIGVRLGGRVLSEVGGLHPLGGSV